MEGVQTFDAATAASAMRWWRDAGVDVLVQEAPRMWLRTNPLPLGESVAERSDAGRGAVFADSAPLPGSSAAVPLPEGERVEVALPPTLPDLLVWMRDSADAPEAAWGRTRILPAGDPQSDVMIVTDMPEPDDAEAGRQLSGEIGALFDRMLAAIGRRRETIWLSPIATARAIGRISAEAEQRLAEIMRHQIALVAPKRLLVMGKLPNELLLGPDWQARRGGLQSINLGAVEVDAVATFHPRLLHERPKFKAEAWKDLQLLMKGL